MKKKKVGNQKMKLARKKKKIKEPSEVVYLEWKKPT